MPAYKPQYSKGHKEFVPPTWKVQFVPEDKSSWLKTVVISPRGYNEEGKMIEAIIEGEFSSEEEASPMFSEQEAKQWVASNPDYPDARIVYDPGYRYTNYFR